MKLKPVLAAALGILTLNSSFALAEYRGDQRHRQDQGNHGPRYAAPAQPRQQYQGQRYQGQGNQGQGYQGQGYHGQSYGGPHYQTQHYQAQHYQAQHYQGQHYPGQGYPRQYYPSQGYYQQGYYGPSYQLQRGGYVDRGRWEYAQRVDYHYHQLRQPPYGYEWRSYDGNWVLAALASGLIMEILINGR